MVVLWHDTEETAYSHNDSTRRTRQGSHSPYQGPVWLSIRHCSDTVGPADGSTRRWYPSPSPEQGTALISSCLKAGVLRAGLINKQSVRRTGNTIHPISWVQYDSTISKRRQEQPTHPGNSNHRVIASARNRPGARREDQATPPSALGLFLSRTCATASFNRASLRGPKPGNLRIRCCCAAHHSFSGVSMPSSS
jgi:hypothetical protein